MPTAVFGAVLRTLLGIGLGIELGIGLGIALQRGLVSEASRCSPCLGPLILAMLLASGAAGVLATGLPASRAVRLNILHAIASA